MVNVLTPTFYQRVDGNVDFGDNFSSGLFDFGDAEFGECSWEGERDVSEAAQFRIECCHSTEAGQRGRVLCNDVAIVKVVVVGRKRKWFQQCCPLVFGRYACQSVTALLQVETRFQLLYSYLANMPRQTIALSN